MKCRARGERQSQSQKDAQENRHAIKGVGGKRGSPHLRTIGTGNTYLAIRKFQQSGKVGLHKRGCQTLRQENNRPAGALEREGKRIVVAEGMLPNVQHTDLLEDWSANGGASAPTKIVGLRPEHADHPGIPGGEECGWEVAAIRDKPPHGGCGTNTGIAERRDHMVQPGLAGTSVGIHEDQDLKFWRELLNGDAQIVDLFAAILRLASQDDAGFYA